MSQLLRYKLIGGLLLAICSGCGGSGNNSQNTPDQPPTAFFGCPLLPASSSPAGSLGAIVDGAVATEMKAAKLPSMTIAIAKNGTVLYSQGYGYANISSCIPVQSSAEYQIGSVTKQFTAAAILQLRNAGKLDIDDTVVSHLPGYSFDSRITLRMLLNHTSGLDDYINNPVQFPPPPGWLNGLSEQYVLTRISQAPLVFTPGSAYSYSNSNYFVLGTIVEAVSGMTYADYLTTHILQPLGLLRTSYLQPLAAAFPYSYNNPAVPGTSGLAPSMIPDPSVFFSAGALWSNVQDLATWDAALLSGNVVPASLLTLMMTPPASIPVYKQAGSSSKYAMGWVRDTVSGRPFAWHNGETLAYTSFNGVFLDDGFSVSLLTNVDIQENTPLFQFAVSLIEAICTSPSTASSC